MVVLYLFSLPRVGLKNDKNTRQARCIVQWRDFFCSQPGSPFRTTKKQKVVSLILTATKNSCNGLHPGRFSAGEKGRRGSL